MRLVLAVAAAVFIGGCRTAELEPATETRQYVCDGFRFTAVVEPGRVVARLPDRELVLEEFVGATGPRYSDGRSMLWFENGQATLQYDDRTYVCQPSAEQDQLTADS